MFKQYLNDLEKYRDFDVEGNVDKFDETLGKIAQLNDPNSISSLVKYLDDESDYYEVLYGIVHLIEQFDDHTYLNELLPTIPWMVRHSPEWAKVLHYRILNSPSTFNVYMELIPSQSDDTKKSIELLLDEIKREDEEFAERCGQLLSQLTQDSG